MVQHSGQGDDRRCSAGGFPVDRWASLIRGTFRGNTGRAFRGNIGWVGCALFDQFGGCGEGLEISDDRHRRCRGVNVSRGGNRPTSHGRHDRGLGHLAAGLGAGLGFGLFQSGQPCCSPLPRQSGTDHQTAVIIDVPLRALSRLCGLLVLIGGNPAQCTHEPLQLGTGGVTGEIHQFVLGDEPGTTNQCTHLRVRQGPRGEVRPDHRQVHETARR